MLRELTIENVAVIEKASISFDNGFTCLTGETGAGKSIIIDSINAIMGDRVSKDVIRHGAQKASIVAVFENLNKDIISLAEEMDIDISIMESDYLMTVEHTYPDFAITMHTYLCKLAHPKFVMKEHVAAKWMVPQEMGKLDWAEADKPIVERLQELYK